MNTSCPTVSTRECKGYGIVAALGFLDAKRDMLEFLDMVLHIDKTFGIWVEQYGMWVYFVLFAIVFAETGLVAFPFLPGDSLLFIAGAFGATGSIDPFLMALLLIVAAILGNSLNYAIGRYIGPRVFSMDLRFLDRGALLRTHVFYEKHGGKTIVLSRFIPMVRTFAPFVAGVANMPYGRFQLFNIAGALIWVIGLIGAGYFFGNIPIIRDHLNTIVLLGLAAAVVPVVGAALFKLLRGKRNKA